MWRGDTKGSPRHNQLGRKAETKEALFDVGINEPSGFLYKFGGSCSCSNDTPGPVAAACNDAAAPPLTRLLHALSVSEAGGYWSNMMLGRWLPPFSELLLPRGPAAAPAVSPPMHSGQPRTLAS